MKLQYRNIDVDSGSGEVTKATPWYDLNFPGGGSTLTIDGCWDFVEIREKPARTAEEIVARLCADVSSIRYAGGDDMDLDHLARTLSGEF